MPTSPPAFRFRHEGQALPLVLVFLIVLCVGLLVTFNTGQVVAKKVELTNAADAAAYSVAVEQARARNLAAYLNRGRVANEVAIAQMVSLNSWVTMVHSTSDHFGDFMGVVSKVLFWVPGLGQALIAIDRAMVVINRALKTFRRNVAIPGLENFIRIYDQVLNQGYATAARAALSTPAALAGTERMVSRVVSDNSPGASITPEGAGVLANDIRQGGEQMELYRPGRGGNGLTRTNEGGERYRNVVMASRDGFTTARRSGSFGVLTSNGGTDLVEYNRWSAVDTFEFRLPIPLASDVTFPLGWGGTQAYRGGANRPSFFRGMNNGRGWRSPYDNRRYAAYNGVGSRSISGRFIEGNPAGQEMGFNRSRAYFGQYRHGLTHDYHDVRARYSKTPEGPDAGPIYTVEVATDVANARTSSAIGVGAGRMALRDEAISGKLQALASAQVYFNRPYDLAAMRRQVWGRGDRKFEMGSTFSPYWQARLVDTPDADRRLLQVR